MKLTVHVPIRDDQCGLRAVDASVRASFRADRAGVGLAGGVKVAILISLARIKAKDAKG